MENNFIQFGDRLFSLYRTIRETTKISKRDGMFYFCNEIPYIEFEEIKENEN
jgi:hypothetical protein